MPCLGLAPRQQGGFLSFPTISPAGCSCREHLEKGERRPGCLPSFMALALGAFQNCSGSGHSKKILLCPFIFSLVTRQDAGLDTLFSFA